MRTNAGLTEHPEHAALIARIVAQWSATEDAYTRLFCYFLGVNLFSASQLFATLVASRARLDLFDAAGHYFFTGDADGLTAFKELLALLRETLKHRNRFAHAIYGIDEKGRLVILRRTLELTNPSGSVEQLPLEELEAAWDLAALTFNTTLNFHVILHSKLPDEFLRALHVVWHQQSGAVRNNLRAPTRDETNADPNA